mgnify:CR=1 FL=1
MVHGSVWCDGKQPTGIADAGVSGGVGQERNEAVTDPIPNDAWTNGAGANHGEEVGDQGGGQMGTPLGTAPDGAQYNQVINGHFYWYQMECSNRGHACLQRLAPPGATPKATFSVTKGGGLTLNFNASGSSVPSGVPLYVWQFNDSFGAQTVEQVIPNLPGYPDNINRASDGTYWLALVGMRTPSLDLALKMPGFRRRMARRVAPDEWLCPNINTGCMPRFGEGGHIL